MKIFQKWRNPYGYTDAELEKWHERLDNLPEFTETFRLIREIVAGHSSVLGTILTQQNAIISRMDRQESATRALIDQVVANNNLILSIADKVEKLSDLATVLILEREEKRNEST